MARLSTDKLQLLKKAFSEDAMTPGQAAQSAGVTYATAKRYYELSDKEIKRLKERTKASYERGWLCVGKLKAGKPSVLRALERHGSVLQRSLKLLQRKSRQQVLLSPRLALGAYLGASGPTIFENTDRNPGDDEIRSG